MIAAKGSKSERDASAHDFLRKLQIECVNFLCTAPSQYVTKIQFTQATVDCLSNDKTKNARAMMKK